MDADTSGMLGSPTMSTDQIAEVRRQRRQARQRDGWQQVERRRSRSPRGGPTSTENDPPVLPPTSHNSGLELVNPVSLGEYLSVSPKDWSSFFASTVFRASSLIPGSLALRPLPPAYRDERTQVAVAAAKETLPPTHAGVPVVGPLLGVRVMCLSRQGSNKEGPRMLNPRVRLSLVDLSTGRYLAPVSPVTPPPKVATVPLLPAPIGSGDLPSPATISALCGPCLNRAVIGDEVMLAKVPTKGSKGGGAPPSAAAPAGSTAEEADKGMLLWGENQVFGVPLAEALANPCATVFVELYDDVLYAPKEGDEPRDTRFAWGYIKCNSRGSGGVSSGEMLGQSRVALGFPPGSEPPTPPPIAPVVRTLQLYALQPLPFGAYAYHVTFFGAIIPQCRYVESTPTNYTVQVPLISRGEEVKRIPLRFSTPTAGLLDHHPMLGRPPYALKLPCDVPGTYKDPTGSAVDDLEGAAGRGEEGEHDDEDHGPDMRRDAVRRLLPTRVPPVAGSVYLDTGVPFLPPSKIRGSLPAGSSGASTLSFSPDGILIAVACVGPSPGIPSQFSIRIYETHDGCEACMPLEGHSGVINSLDWSPDSSWLLSSSSDGTAYVWALPRNLRSPHLLTTIPTLPHARLAHPQLPYVYSARFHPLLPCLIVTAAYDGLLRLWDGKMDEPILTGGFSVEVCREARYLGVIGGEGSGGGGGGEVGGTTTLGGGGESFNSLPFYLNCVEWEGLGLGLGGCPRLLVTGDSRGCLRFYSCPKPDLAHRPERYILEKELRATGLKGAPIVSIRARPPSRSRAVSCHLLVLSQASRLFVYDGLTYQAVRTFTGSNCSAHKIEACWSPDGSMVASGSESGALLLWDADTGSPLPAVASVATVDEAGYVVPGKGRAAIGYPSMMPSVCWSGGAASLAVCGFGSDFNVLMCTSQGDR